MGWQKILLNPKTAGAVSKFFSKKSRTIKNVPIAKNLTTKRSIQDKVVKAVDEGTKKGLGGGKPSLNLKQSGSKSKRVESKKLKGMVDKWDKLVSDRKKADKKAINKLLVVLQQQLLEQLVDM